MRSTYLLAAALTLAMLPGAAAAQSCPQPGSEGSAATGQGGSDQGMGGTGAGDVDEGTGGSAIGNDEGVGGSIGTDQGEVGGSIGSDEGAIGGSTRGDQYPGSNVGGSAIGNDDGSSSNRQSRIREDDRDEGVGGTGMEEERGRRVVIGEDEGERNEKPPAQGLTVAAQGGIEGYTGSLAPRIAPGPAWGVLVGAQPTNVIGLEVAYSGAANQISDPSDPNGRLVRNGGGANVKISLSPRTVEPFLFGGVGISRANVSGGAGRYQDDTFGNVPVGAGLNLHLGSVTAGARVGYNFLFDRDFAPAVGEGDLAGVNALGGDLWNARVQLGAEF